LLPPLNHPREFFIDGEWVAPSTASTLDVIAPANEQLYLRVAEAQREDVNRAVRAARLAFDEGPWPRLSHAERAAYLRAIAARVDERVGDISAIWPNEMGIVHTLAQAFAPGAGRTYRSYADLTATFPFEAEHPTTAGAKIGLLVREPVGVVGIVVPWNGPIMSIAVKLAPALLAGCTAVIKASPTAPGHALLMAEVIEAAGLPKGVVNVITAEREVSEMLVQHPGIDKIAFTGSTVAGKRIAEILSGRMARYTMELGGKSAAIILDDYDCEAAARTIAVNISRMTGQVCAALTRIVITRSRHDRMLEALAAACGSIRLGDPFDPSSQMGPLASRSQFDRVAGYIAGARRDGFTLATGGNRPKDLARGYYIEPTVFGHVRNDSTIAREEVFGPVLCVIPARNETEAVAIANDSDYGLGGAVFTQDPDRAYAVARRMRTGTVGHNGLTADFGIAFGGFKCSGVGREGGTEGLLAFLEPKTVLLHERPRQYLRTS
jgi:acyl-CoA reductase-like NAD-dependent aldehyde dehydrogenase